MPVMPSAQAISQGASIARKTASASAIARKSKPSASDLFPLSIPPSPR
jgi:hypothetical protein